MKPTLYLHCGIYKTGSSFLQTMFVRNRDLLKSKGIFYPKSEKEMDMYEGRITAGNGIHLTRMLSEKESDVIDLMSADLNYAKRMNLNAVLYSSELFFNKFAEKNALNKMCSAAKAAGYGDIRALIYFRDPVSHALSTYKHRAKYGGHPEFDKWLQTEYEIFDLIRAFLEYSKDSKVQWTCRKYRSDSSYMVTSSFTDWLNIKAPEIPEEDRVNQSLQLNEIRVLQSLKKKYTGCENFLREAFLSLQAGDKESETGLKEEYSSLVEEKWFKNRQLLDSLNSRFIKNEKLIIESLNRPCIKNPFITLSEKQIQAVAEGLTSYLKSEKMSYKLVDMCERGVSKLRRKWTASGINSKYLK